jgi:glyoxylase-like metal-dependent hydrolase (beta-lactamase superfamily II)
MIDVKEFLPGLYLVEARLEYISVRGALLKGTQRVAIWDTLSHPSDMKPLHPYLEGKPIFSIYSHADWDHVWGTTGLPGNGGVVIGQDACLERFHSDVPVVLKEMSAEKPQFWKGLSLVPPVITFQKSLVLDLGGLSLEIQHVPGHTRDSLVSFVPELGVLLGGDVLEDPFPMLNETNPLEPWIEALERWADDGRVQWVVPAHGAVGRRELLLNNLAYLRSLRDETPYPMPEKMEAFYSEGHQSNLKRAKEVRS